MRCQFFKQIALLLTGSTIGCGGTLAWQKRRPVHIKIPAQATSGRPVAIIELPDESLLDQTRVPAQDTLTVADTKKGARKNHAAIGEGSVSMWESYIPQDAALSAHRHPDPRMLVSLSESKVDLTRQSTSGKSDRLSIDRRKLYLFAPDPKDEFHNDINPSGEAAQVGVIEFKLR